MTIERSLNTADVAKMLAVSTVTIRRWTDSGILEYTKTAGGHRRYRNSTIHAFSTPKPDFYNGSNDWHKQLMTVQNNERFYHQLSMANTMICSPNDLVLSNPPWLALMPSFACLYPA